MLLGGSDHVIAGNQFGGSVSGVALPGAALQAIAIGVNAGGSLVVGGPAVADRNVIGGGGFYGINVQSTVVSTPEQCRIVNNLNGVAANGFAPLPNFTGIGLGGGACTVASNRIVGNSQDAILINGGNGNVIQDNLLGVDVHGNGALNSGAGVHITSGSGNVIGTSAASNITGLLFSNTIRFMVDGGVLATAGSGNSIRSNLIYDNGATGSGMDIDLGGVGPTPNDGGDIDSGPNLLQNFPLASGVAFAAPPLPNATNVAVSVGGALNAQPGNYRVDAYFANGCNANGRGHAEAYAGAKLVTIAAGATRARFVLGATLPNVQGDGVLAFAATMPPATRPRSGRASRSTRSSAMATSSARLAGRKFASESRRNNENDIAIRDGRCRRRGWRHPGRRGHVLHQGRAGDESRVEPGAGQRRGRCDPAPSRRLHAECRAFQLPVR
jgi:hypothetical protein